MVTKADVTLRNKYSSIRESTVMSWFIIEPVYFGLCFINRTCLIIDVFFLPFIYQFQLEIWEKVHVEKLKDDLKRLLKKGIKSLAVVLLHSYMYVQ